MSNSTRSVTIGEVSPLSPRGYARWIAPRKHFRVLPTRTRPSLFGGD